MNPRLILRGLALIASLVAIGYLVDALQLGHLLDKDWIDRSVRGQGLDGELLFIAAGALATGFGLPRQLIAFLGGYAFGFLEGSLYALAAASLGCAAAFLYARLFGRALVVARFAKRIQRLNDFVEGHPFSMTLLIRLLPVGSNLATNLTAGVSQVPAWPFLLGSAIGYLPQTLVFTLAGSGVNLDPLPRIGLAAALLVVSALLGIHLYRRFRHGHSIGRELDAELGVDDETAATSPTLDRP
ncbi:TVP38/TMEM64 family protein [Endothiovibrio diazotrophicus]